MFCIRKSLRARMILPGLTIAIAMLPFLAKAQGTLYITEITDSYMRYEVRGGSNACITNPRTYIMVQIGDETINYTKDGKTIATIKGKVDFQYPGQEKLCDVALRYTGLWCDYTQHRDAFSRNLESLRAPTNVVCSQAAYGDAVAISWKGQTTFDHTKIEYLVYRNNGVIKTIPGNSSRTYSYKDTGLEPGRTYTYKIQTKLKNTHFHSSLVTKTGSVFDAGLQASSDIHEQVRLTWENYSSLTGLTGWTIEQKDDQGVVVATYNVENDDTPECFCDKNMIPGYWYSFTLKSKGNTSVVTTVKGRSKPEGIIRGHVQTPVGGAVGQVDVQVRRVSDVEGDTTTRYSALSSSEDGSYTVSGIYYHTLADFEVSPVLEGHEFDPGMASVTLLQGAGSIQDGVDFTDTSSFTIEGTVMQHTPEGPCPLPGVEIEVDGLFQGGLTDVSGHYSLTVPQPGDYVFRPLLEEHHFEPAEINTTIVDNTTGLDFTDSTYFTLSGAFTDPCGEGIGTATLRFSSLGDPACYTREVTVDNPEGTYQLELPAREYSVELISFVPAAGSDVIADEVTAYFAGSLQADLTGGDLDLKHIYHKEPVVSLESGLKDGKACTGEIILRQARQYELAFAINESFGDDRCLVDSGYIVVRQDITDQNVATDTFYFDQGVDTIYLVPGEPNLVPPHTRFMDLTVHANGKSSTTELDVIVLGVRQRGQNYFSTTPEIPLHVIHDPPGDGSYAFLEDGTTLYNSWRTSYMTSGSLNAWSQTKLGLAFSVGVSIGAEASAEIAFWAQARAGLEIGAGASWTHDWGFETTTTEKFSTSGNENVIGGKGDVYIGGTLNYMYSLADVLEYDRQNCQLNLDTRLMMTPEGFESTFIYTEDHILNTLIPNLLRVRDELLKVGNDSASLYQSYADAWKEYVAGNHKNMAEAELIETVSFSAETSYESTVTEVDYHTQTFDFNTYIEASLAVEAGVEMMGTGQSLGAEVKLRFDFGTGSTWGQKNSLTTSFILEDDDNGDNFMVDILADPVHKTPVFKLRGGRSSCPYEPGTEARESLQLQSNRYSHSVGAEEEAVFLLQMGNTSESEEDNEYELIFDPTSNPYGAEVKIGGSPVVGNVPTPYFIPAGQGALATVTVKKGPMVANYEDLRFVLRSACDPQVSDYVELDANFGGGCSQANIENGTSLLLNRAGEELIELVISGYDLSSLDHLELQYRKSGDMVWSRLQDVATSELGQDNSTLNIDLAELNDGDYEFRVLSHCSGDYSTSSPVDLKVDRISPYVIGYPEPSSGIYEPGGDIISALFNESIDLVAITETQIEVFNYNGQNYLDYQFGGQDNTLIIKPLDLATVRNGDTLQVTLNGIKDLAGNVMDEPLTWAFSIPDKSGLSTEENMDSDLDQLTDNADNCPLAYNPGQEDMDDDGAGDACDDDIDGDGKLNLGDNCPVLANGDQADGDGDGIGDACDEDLDNDGVINEMDNCPMDPNTGQDDSDEDGTGDICDESGIGDLVHGNILECSPNPFSERTEVHIWLDRPGELRVDLIDLSGRVVRVLCNGQRDAGAHIFELEGEELSAGIYLLRSQAGDQWHQLRLARSE